jgi:hypothetical protein
MNDLESLSCRIQEALPDADVSVDVPADPAGRWFLDVRCGDRSMVIEWIPARGFGVSTSPGGYGEGPERLLRSTADVEREVLSL